MSAPAKSKQNEIIGLGTDKDGNTEIHLSNGAVVTVDQDGMIEVSSKFLLKRPEIRRTFARKIEIRFR